MTTAAEDIPVSWFRQLRDGGLLLLPFHLGSNPWQYLLKLKRQGNCLDSEWIGQVGFIGMKGMAGVHEKAVALDDRLERLSDEEDAKADLVLWMDASDQPKLNLIRQAIRGKEPRVSRIVNAPTHFHEWAGFRLFLFLESGEDMFLADSMKPTSRQFLGLIAPDESCALLSNNVLSWGSNRALEILDAQVDRWDALGRPVLSDFSLRFFPKELLDRETFHLGQINKGWLVSMGSHLVRFSL
ncbi:MAG: hypothetical protein HYU64_08200 [Armatimonadetes bacterium]|nr:hypothetical protein [Armatimonadota bacterium]